MAGAAARGAAAGGVAGGVASSSREPVSEEAGYQTPYATPRDEAEIQSQSTPTATEVSSYPVLSNVGLVAALRLN